MKGSVTPIVATLVMLMMLLIAPFASAKHDGANAGGGAQVSRPDLTPVLTEEDCVVILPAGISLEDCEVTNASDNSGFASLICRDITVSMVCPEDSNDTEDSDN